ncbi:hypothetical protein GQ457_08G012530 [Hibiscus cannabinus]
MENHKRWKKLSDPYGRGRANMPPSSPGGRVLRKEVDHGLSINLELILPGSMPERLMGTDCKFVGNMSTLVQI